MRITKKQDLDPSAETLAFYDERADQYASVTLLQSMEHHLRPFAAMLDTGGRIADLGCGAGRDMKFLRESGFAAVGLDRSKRLAAIANKFANCPVVVGDLCGLPFAEGAFAGAWAAASLLHLSRNLVSTAIAEARRILQPGGVFFVSLKRGEGQSRDNWGRLFTLFEVDELQSALASAGFNVVETRIDRRTANEMARGIAEWISCTAVKQ